MMAVIFFGICAPLGFSGTGVPFSMKATLWVWQRSMTELCGMS